MSDHDDDSVVLVDDLGMEHVDKLLQGKYTLKNLGTLGFEGCVKGLQLFNRRQAPYPSTSRQIKRSRSQRRREAGNSSCPACL